MSSNKLTALLERFRGIKREHDAVAVATGERFNVFAVLGMYHAEMKHSAILAEFLNPRGLHSQGAVFLRLFVEMLQARFPSQFSWNLSTDDTFDDFEVTTEASEGIDGRIDILLENEVANKCIIIENKIYAADQERQLGRYYDFAMEKFKHKTNIVVIYLTLDGEVANGCTLYGNEPDDYTLRTDMPECKQLDKEQVLCVSYEYHIVKWLYDCVKEVAHLAPIRETLFQYQSLLKSITCQTLNREFIMTSNKIFLENRNYELVLALEESIAAFKNELKDMLWRDIRSKFTETCKERPFKGEVSEHKDEKRYHLSVLLDMGDDANNDAAKIIVVIVMEFRRKGREGEIFYYFDALDEKGNWVERYSGAKKKARYGKYTDTLKAMGLKQDLNWSAGWRHYHSEGKTVSPTFGKPDENLIRQMACEDKRKKIADKVVSQVKTLVELFLAELKKTL